MFSKNFNKGKETVKISGCVFFMLSNEESKEMVKILKKYFDKKQASRKIEHKKPAIINK